MIRAVLFDWGNTLTAWEHDTELLVAGHRAGLAAAGPGVPAQEAFTAAFTERIMPALLAPREDEIDYAAAVGDLLHDLGSDADDEAVWQFVVAEQDVWQPSHHLEPSALWLLDAVRERGLGTGLVANLFDPPSLVRDLLGELGLLGRLDTIALSAEVGKRKPHPALFRHALDALGLLPDEAVMVGDRLRDDIGGAHALGLRTIQALWFVTDTGEGPEPDERASTPRDVVRILDGWAAEA